MRASDRRLSAFFRRIDSRSSAAEATLWERVSLFFTQPLNTDLIGQNVNSYKPESDGAWLASDAGKPGTAVALGETYTYTWKVLPSSVGTWPYHDHSMPQMLYPGAPPMPEA